MVEIFPASAIHVSLRKISHSFQTKKVTRHIFFVVLLVFLIFGFGILGLWFLGGLKKPQFWSLAKEPLGQTEKGEVEYLANEFLVKLKRESLEKLKNKQNPSTQDSGILTLDKLNKDFQAVKIEKVAKDEKKSNKDHDIFLWYKITLPGNSDIIKEARPQQKNGQSDSTGKTRLKSILERYRKDPNIQEAELNYIVRTTAVPNDPYFLSSGSWGQTYDDLWGLKKIQAEKAWDVATGSAQVTVGVIDTGIDYNHKDIADNVWTNQGEVAGNGIDDDQNGYVDDYYGYDFSTCAVLALFFCSQPKPLDNDPFDDNGHGTHLAGIIGAVGNNNTGVVGVNWAIKVMAVKFLNSQGAGFVSDAANSIIYAVDNQAKILNLAWILSFFQTPESLKILDDALDYSARNNVINVAAAGNFAEYTSFFYPANHPEVIAVASSDHNDSKSDFSNFGVEVDVAAPGGDSENSTKGTNYDYVNILSLKSSQSKFPEVFKVGDEYLRLRGTSPATAYVSGLAALLLSLQPDLSREEIRHLLQNTADKVSGKNFDIGGFGFGRINAFQAISQVISENPALPTAKITKPVSNSITASPVSILGKVSSRYGLESYTLEFGEGIDPQEFNLIKTVSISGREKVFEGQLTLWDVPKSGVFTLLLTAKDIHNRVSQDRVVIRVDTDLMGNWPKNVKLSTAPGIGDIDGDGKKEIVAVEDAEMECFGEPYGSGSAKIYAWELDGSLVSGWPVEILPTNFVSPADCYSIQLSEPVLADLNGDKQDEIVFSSNTVIARENSKDVLTQVYILEGNSNFSGWPKTLSQSGLNGISAPAVGDIDANGTFDILVKSALRPSGSSNTTYMIHAWNTKGEDLSGWPKVTATTSDSSSLVRPVLANIIGDAYLEIVSVEAEGTVHVLNFKGEELTGWPQKVEPGLLPPAVGDINGDGLAEIVVSVFSGSTKKIYVWDRTGNRLANWLDNLSFAGNLSKPILADFNNDRKKEILIKMEEQTNDREPTYTTTIFVWQHDGVPISGWPKVLNAKLTEVLGLSFGGGQSSQVIFSTSKTDLGLVVLDNSANQILTNQIGYAEGGPAPIVGDFDGNGKLEIITHIKYLNFPFGSLPFGLKRELKSILALKFRVADSTCVLIQDIDFDGLYDCEEFTLGTNPNKVDSDGDGLSDFEEVNYDGNPVYTPGKDTNPLVFDTDGDICGDKRELFANEIYGGRRDPLNPWDFYDVPVPVIRKGQTSGTRNGAINLQDLVAVLYYVGTSQNGPPNGNGVDYDNDLNGNGLPDGKEYDRTPVLSQPWRSGPPDGLINLQDVSVIRNQIGHSCISVLPK